MSDVHFKKITGELLIACALGNLEEVKLLVKAGADIHGEGDTARRWARINMHKEIVNYLELARKMQELEI